MANWERGNWVCMGAHRVGVASLSLSAGQSGRLCAGPPSLLRCEHHPLNPDKVIPFTKYFCRNKNTNRDGTTASVAPVITRFMFC